jgi:hypothetical protein
MPSSTKEWGVVTGYGIVKKNHDTATGGKIIGVHRGKKEIRSCADSNCDLKYILYGIRI